MPTSAFRLRRSSPATPSLLAPRTCIGGRPKSRANVKGYVRGFDARTGKRLWIFHTIPQKGEFGRDTWEGNSADYTGNTGVWTQISVDEELGLAYLPVELPTSDTYGGHRPGNGLFGESIVAVDLKTGQRNGTTSSCIMAFGISTFLARPYSLTSRSMASRSRRSPSRRSKVSSTSSIESRVSLSGRLIERPAPKGDVPGEWYAATQPIPTKPPFYGRNGFSQDDLIDFTPDLKQQALKRVSKYKLGPVFTPPVVSNPKGPVATLIIGFPFGGTNWPGGSYDPETRILYVFSESNVGVMGLVPPDPGTSDMAYLVGTAPGADNSPLTIEGLPLIKPPYGQISAINLDSGEILWQVAHGETPDEIRNSPLLKGLEIPRTGRAGIIGALTTKTLVIAGEAGVFTDAAGHKGALLRAYDKATGRDAGAVPMPAGQTGSPMTYMFHGKQYLVVAVGGSGVPGRLLAFRLPD